MREKITAAMIDALPVGGRVWDIEPGLYAERGARSVAWKLYVRHGGQQVRMTIGKYPALSPSLARREASAKKSELFRGSALPKRLPRIGEMIDQYAQDELRLVRSSDGTWKPRAGEPPRLKAWKEKMRVLERYVRPAFGRKRADELAKQDVGAWHRRMVADAPYQANRCLAHLSRLYVWAQTVDLVPVHLDPTIRVPRAPEKRRETAITDAEMARAIWKALEARENEKPHAVAALQLLMLTGARFSEIVGRVLERDGNVVTLRDHKTADKAGAKILVLPDPAVAIVEKHGLDGKTVSSESTVKRLWRAVRKEVGCEQVRIHDLRHTFGTYAASVVGLHGAGSLLGHRNVATTKRYTHAVVEEAVLTGQKAGARVADLYGLK